MRWKATATALLVTLVPSVGGCVVSWHSHQRILGPVLYRTTRPPVGDSYVLEVRAAPVLLEAGDRNSIAIGVIQRVDIAPEVCGTQRPVAARPATSEDWQFSLFFNNEDMPSPPLFKAWKTWGAEISVGADRPGISVGYSSSTRFAPHANAVQFFAYDSDRPLDSVMRLWPYQPGVAIRIPDSLQCREDST